MTEPKTETKRFKTRFDVPTELERAWECHRLGRHDGAANLGFYVKAAAREIRFLREQLAKLRPQRRPPERKGTRFR